MYRSSYYGVESVTEFLIPSVFNKRYLKKIKVPLLPFTNSTAGQTHTHTPVILKNS